MPRPPRQTTLRIVAMLLCTSAAVAFQASPAAAQLPDSSRVRTALESLRLALEQRDLAPLSAALDDRLRFGQFEGPLAHTILSQIVASGRVPAEAVTLDSVRAEADGLRVFATFSGDGRQRNHDVLLTSEFRFLEINVARVSAPEPGQLPPAVSTMPVSSRPGGEAASPPPPMEAVRQELLAMLEHDQRYRGRDAQVAAGDAGAAVSARLQQELDSANVVRLERIVAEHGWPSISAVGATAATAAFLVLQHGSPAAREKYLPLVRELAARGEVPAGSLPLLEDRVRMQRGEPQIFGTQLHTNPQTGKLELWPIDDEAGVHQRRAAAGLPPLADYLRSFGIEYRR